MSFTSPLPMSTSPKVGIHGHPFINAKEYFVSAEIIKTYLRCHNALSDINKTLIDPAEKNRLLSLIASVYTKSAEYMEKAIKNSKTYTYTYSESYADFFSCNFYKPRIEKGTDPSIKRSLQSLAFIEFHIDMGTFDRLTKAKNQELLNLIEIKEEFCPNLKREIDACGGFDPLTLDSNAKLSKREKQFVDFLDCLNTASTGEMSPIYTPIAEIAPATPDPLQADETVGIDSPIKPDEARLAQELPNTSSIQAPEAPSEMTKVGITFKAGWGNTLGICCEPLWDKQPPILFSNQDNDWIGEVPVSKEWKFVIIEKNGHIKWENGGNRKIYPEASAPDLNYTGKVNFS